MKVGIIQSSFIPWRGYFDFIRSVDLFVFLDDVQYTQRDWRNRNRIKTRGSVQWLTVPVMHGSARLPIRDTRIDHSKPWAEQHQRIFRENYRDAPFFQDAAQLLEESCRCHGTISQLNVAWVRRICEYLGIGTELRMSWEFGPRGTRTQRLIEILVNAGASTYLTGPSAMRYLDLALFRRHAIALQMKSYDYGEYPQQWGTFIGDVSILDLIANCGPSARGHIHSRTPDVELLPEVSTDAHDREGGGSEQMRGWEER